VSAGPLLTAEVPGDVEARTAVQAVRKVYPDIRLESQELQYSPRLLYDIVEDVLTERQFTSLQTAYYGGYFETPGRASVTNSPSGWGSPVKPSIDTFDWPRIPS